jgi:hypothetical protein
MPASTNSVPGVMHAPRHKRRSEARRNLTIAATMFALVVALAVGGLWLLGKSAATGPFACSGYEFSRSEWRKGGSDERRDQARLMARCDHLLGKTRKQVLASLGDPDGGPSNESEWRFFIGKRTDFLRLGDSGHLMLRFNSSGRVVRAEVPETES